MCGLVGIMGTIGKVDVDVFQQLLIVDTIRGPHSTGVASYTWGGKSEIIKQIGVATNLLGMKAYDLVANEKSQILMGHNRWKTVGEASVANAHPFEHGSVIGAHNGTLPWATYSKFKDHNKYGTDSEAMIAEINEFGLDKTIEKMNNGAYAITLLDKEAKTFQLIRNKERPLYWCWSVDLTHIYWASELEMLEWILDRNGIKYLQPDLLEVNKLLTFKLPAARNAKLEVPTVRTLVPAPEVASPRTFRPKWESVSNDWWGRYNAAHSADEEVYTH